MSFCSLVIKEYDVSFKVKVKYVYFRMTNVKSNVSVEGRQSFHEGRRKG